MKNTVDTIKTTALELNPMCKDCINLGKDCDGDHGTTFTGCLWRVVELLIVDVESLDVYCISNSDTENYDIAKATESNFRKIAQYNNLLKQYPDNKIFQSMLCKAEKCRYTAMTYTCYERLQRSRRLGGLPVEIDEAQYFEALNCLPPLKWCTVHGVEMFCMSEMDWGSLTAQYAFDRSTGKYFTKTVDVLDSSTWIHNFIA